MLDRAAAVERGLDEVPNYDEAMERSRPYDEAAARPHQPPSYTPGGGGDVEDGSGGSVWSVCLAPTYEEALKHEIVHVSAAAAPDITVIGAEAAGGTENSASDDDSVDESTLESSAGVGDESGDGGGAPSEDGTFFSAASNDAKAEEDLSTRTSAGQDNEAFQKDD